MDQQTASTKWCPFSRVSDDDGSTFNRRWDGQVHEATACLGPACMVWRRRHPNSAEGYCGLAGSPWRTP